MHETLVSNILLSNIFETVWSEAMSLDLAELIHAIQAPPFERIGVMDLESFYPVKERYAWMPFRRNAGGGLSPDWS